MSDKPEALECAELLDTMDMPTAAAHIRRLYTSALETTRLAIDQMKDIERLRAEVEALRADAGRLEAAEPVAWQRRMFLGGKWEEWAACEPLADGESMDYTYPDTRVRYQFRKLYTAPTPPAAIPALTDEEMPDSEMAYMAGATWAYALAAERAGVQIKEQP